MRAIKVSKHLERHLEGANDAKFGKISLGIGAFLLFFTLGYLNPVFFIPAILSPIVCILLSAYHSKEASVFKSGVEGEKILKERLHQTLSDDYIGFFSLPLPKGDVDCLLVGPTGVFLFDVKHHRGVVVQQNGSWEYIKQSSGGNYYKKSMRNPIKQIKREIAQIKNLFTQNGLGDLWIEGAVVFTHPEAELHLEASENGNLKVIKIDEIESIFARNESRIKAENLEKIERLLFSIFSGKNSRDS